MDFRVEITDLAVEDIDEAAAFIARDSVMTATKWKSGLETLILSLAMMPGRFAVIPEAAELKMPYRSAVYFSHRVVFRIDDEKHVVYVTSVYHGARRALTRLDVDPPNWE